MQNHTLLAIETGLGAATVALWQHGACLGHTSSTDAHANASELVPMIEALLAQHGMGYQQLTHLACGIGPGSFTGIRIGLAAARGLALALNIPLLGIDTLSATAFATYQSAPELRAQPVVVAIDAMRGQLYTQCFTWNETRTQPAFEAILTDTETLEPWLQQFPLAKTTIAGNAKTIINEWLGEKPLQHIDILADATHIGQMALAIIALGEHPAPVPLYVRAPDAKLPSKPPIWLA